MKERTRVMMIALLLSLHITVGAMQKNDLSYVLHENSIVKLGAGTRKSDELVIRYLEGKKTQASLMSLQMPTPHSENANCQEHCLRCTTFIDCLECETGYILTEGQCLEEFSEPEDQPIVGDEQELSLKKEGISWIIWFFLFCCAAGSCFFLISRCRRQPDAEQYHNPHNHENKMFEMTKKGNTPARPHHEGVTPGIAISINTATNSKVNHTDQKIYSSELIDNNFQLNSSPLKSEIIANKVFPTSETKNLSSPFTGFSSFRPGNSPQPLVTVGEPVEKQLTTNIKDFDAEVNTAENYTMTRKGHPTELKSKDPNNAGQAMKLNAYDEKGTLGNKTPPSKLGSPELHDSKDLSSEKKDTNEIVTSKFFVSQLPGQNPK